MLKRLGECSLRRKDLLSLLTYYDGLATRWATLLTPKQITLEASMEGFELDLASPDFQTLMVDNRDVVTPGILSQCYLFFF